jgi:NodT family efflux transporter outer membrane factor (OMF) lipoprotein
MAPDPVEIEPVTRMPERYAEAGADSVGAMEWWATFDDPTLDALVVGALSANLDITEAVARVEEVRATYAIARSPLFPSVTVGGDYSRFSQPANAGQFGAIFGDGEAPDSAGGPLRPTRFAFSNFGASLSVAYELDFWGRVNSGRNAAMADLLATASDLNTVQIGVVSETIAAYFELREQLARESLLIGQIDILTERLQLTEGRYQRGVSTSLELYQIQQDLNATRAGLPLVGAQIAATRGRLAVLLGRYPSEIQPMLDREASPLVSTDPIPAGLPSSMLEVRPDLQAAALRLEASRQRVGERKAARLPSISLTGTLGQQSNDLSNLVRADQWFTNFVASITAPIFQGGRLKADQEAAEARYAQEAARYARSVLTAFQEVEAALANFNAQRERQLVLDEQLLVAEASAEAQLRRVESGVGEYVAYLDALRTVNNVLDTRATAERELATARLDVHRALGGAWIPDPQTDESTEADTESAEATDDSSDAPEANDDR